MNKIKLITITSILTLASTISFAQVSFQFSVPQPDFISSDWDGDGIKNSEDDDDDNDGILDVNDTASYDNSGKNSYVAPECIEPPFGFYPSHMEAYIPAFFKLVYVDDVLYSHTVTWDSTVIMTNSDSDAVPNSSANSVTVDGYKYWLNESRLIHTSFPSSIGAVFKIEQYQVCRIPS